MTKGLKIQKLRAAKDLEHKGSKRDSPGQSVIQSVSNGFEQLHAAVQSVNLLLRGRAGADVAAHKRRMDAADIASITNTNESIIKFIKIFIQ